MKTREVDRSAAALLADSADSQTPNTEIFSEESLTELTERHAGALQVLSVSL